jgi:thiol-disulfide isomerase/thioredoxin
MLRKIFIISIIFSYSLFAQEFKLKSIEGDLYDFNISKSKIIIKEFPNKVILLDFFSTTCQPCLKELPELTKLQETFHDNLQIIGIESASKKDDKKMQKFAKKHNLNYPIFSLKESGDLIQYVLEHTNWNGALPFKLLYHSRGTLSYQLYGAMSWEKLTGALGDL